MKKKNIKDLLNIDLAVILENAELINRSKGDFEFSLQSKFLDVFETCKVLCSTNLVTDLFFKTKNINTGEIQKVFQTVLQEYGLDFYNKREDWSNYGYYGWCFENFKHEKVDLYNDSILYAIFIFPFVSVENNNSIELHIRKYNNIENFYISL